MAWLTLLSIAKFAFYTGIISFIGITAMRWLIRASYSAEALHTLHKPLITWLWGSLLLSVIGALAIIPLNAGMLLEDGVAGMTDSLMLQITWESSIGEQALARCIALLLIAVCLFWQAKTRAQAGWSAPFWGLILLTVGVISWSFTLSGHTAAATGLEQLLVAVHVIMAGWWVGSFYPLIKLCSLKEPVALKRTLHQYGKHAVFFVGLLMLSGASLLLLLLLNVSSEVNSTYLWVMGGKLTLVIIMLCFAAYHKWYLAANLHTAADCVKIKHSIIAEATFGVLVLGVTATLTSSVGIAH